MFTLDEQSDVFADACVSDHRAQLLFVSVYGRDTSIQQLLARLHQPTSQGGVDQLTLRSQPDRAVPAAVRGSQQTLQVLVGDPARLDKLTGRLPRTGLLGNLLQAWIFDPVVQRLDPATGSAWLLDLNAVRVSPAAPGSVDRDAARRVAMEAEQAWRLVKELSPLPLLDHWMLPILSHLQTVQALQRPPCLGPVSALRIEMPEGFSAWVSEQVKAGVFSERRPSGVEGPEAAAAQSSVGVDLRSSLRNLQKVA